MSQFRLRLILATVVVFIATPFRSVVTRAQADLPLGVVDTQPNGDTPPSPTDSLAKISVPDGFRVTLFAGEPDVHQPIDMTFDDRGRLWVVENFSYPDWQAKDSDRILIFEDSDNDGQFDSRVVFADNLSNITGITLGFGGVWACSTPHLIFIPDRDQDDKPDGPAVIKLNGWNDTSDDIEHNVFNGLVWGPDGWMYGGHGILANSLVGKPGTPAKERERLNCGIWRYHPVTETFQVVAHGTTNPWGIDFNDLGQCFFTNSVIGHLWHLIPGARYERMYGTHFNPHAYALIDQCADHYHWGGGKWTESRGGKGIHNEAGGGHAHVGAMIYRGGTWPDKYHGSLFTANLHGNRINRDTIQRQGSGYVARHADDFLMGNDPWFRGIDLLYGPDGNVFVSDWTDLGECHDNDGTHRSSGRIYKVSYGERDPMPQFDLADRTNLELLAMSQHKNAWHWTHALRLLHERATAGDDMDDVSQASKATLRQQKLTTRDKLRMLDALSLIGTADRAFAFSLLQQADEYVQCWAVRWLSDANQMDGDASQRLQRILPEATPMLKLQIASATRRISSDADDFDYWSLAAAMIQNMPADDPNLTSMIWSFVEPLADVDSDRFLLLAQVGQDLPQLSRMRQFIARQLITENPKDAAKLEAIMTLATRIKSPAATMDLLVGLRDGLKGERYAVKPKRWSVVQEKLSASRSPKADKLVTELSIKFRDATTIRRLRTAAANERLPVKERANAITLLAENRVAGTHDLLLGLLDDKPVRTNVIRSLNQFNTPRVAASLISRFNRFTPPERAAAVSTLVSSRPHAKALLSAVANGKIESTAIQPSQALTIFQLRDETLRKALKEHWGDVRNSSRENKQKIADWKAQLGPKTLAKADLENGARVFNDTCGKCHKLFGRGGEIGPELTGSDRRNLDYLLQNVVTPSAVVGKEFRMQTVVLESGLVVSGALREQTRGSVVVQTAEKRVTISRDDIQSIEQSDLSLMPEGQFDALPIDSVRDLVGYLQSN